MTDAVTVTDESIWKPEDVQPGVKVGTYQASEVWMIAYETTGRDGRLALVSLSDGMIAHRHKTREELAQMFNEDRRPHVAALATQPQDQRIAGLEAEVERLNSAVANHQTAACAYEDGWKEALAREEQLREGLEVIADGDGDAQEIAQQTLDLTPPQALSKRDGEVLALREAVEGLLRNMQAPHAVFESGCCMCGDDMDAHPDPMSSGHTPVDSGLYYADQAMEQARQALKSSTQAVQDAEDTIRADERGKSLKPDMFWEMNGDNEPPEEPCEWWHSYVNWHGMPDGPVKADFSTAARLSDLFVLFTPPEDEDGEPAIQEFVTRAERDAAFASLSSKGEG